ncbi:hypothetical protein C4552_03425 [Candidatus Parcubacteria bacterium]|nr:MAG: hypothetical protein C4552_03425 [Candidatus Parcubacteria bacterium]
MTQSAARAVIVNEANGPHHPIRPADIRITGDALAGLFCRREADTVATAVVGLAQERGKWLISTKKEARAYLDRSGAKLGITGRAIRQDFTRGWEILAAFLATIGEDSLAFTPEFIEYCHTAAPAPSVELEGIPA